MEATADILLQMRLFKQPYTDYGQPFTSELFTSHLTTQCVQHITQSPMYPQSIEFIEEMLVQ